MSDQNIKLLLLRDLDGRVVDFSLPVAICGHGQRLPLHARIQDPEDEVEEAMIAEFASGSALGQGEVREDKFMEVSCGELHGNRRGCRLFGWCGHEVRASFESG